MPFPNEEFLLRKTLEQAAKYICTQQCGNCPHAIEKFSCLVDCGQDTRPWRCWISYFQEKALQETSKSANAQTKKSAKGERQAA